MEKGDLATKNGCLHRVLDHYSQLHEELMRVNVKLKNVIRKESNHRAALATKLEEITKHNFEWGFVCSNKGTQIDQPKESLADC